MAFSLKAVLEIVVILRDRRPALSPALSLHHAVIHYGKIFHRQQLALEGNELMNMHRPILINYAFDSEASWGGQGGLGMAQSCNRRLAHKDFL